MAIDNAQLYRAAQSAVRSREEVLAVVSHDLKSPLQGIRLNAEVVAAAGGDAEFRGKRVDNIQRAPCSRCCA